MKRWLYIKIFFILISILLVLFAGLLFYKYSGLNYYVRATQKILSLSDPEGSKASTVFYGDRNDAYTYTGTLAKVDDKGVWIWGNKGLKYFRGNVNSIYSFTDGCTERTINPKKIDYEDKIEFRLFEKVYKNIDLWKEHVKEGDFVIIILSSKTGMFTGNIGQALAYNWWYFLQTDMKTACEK